MYFAASPDSSITQNAGAKISILFFRSCVVCNFVEASVISNFKSCISAGESSPDRCFSASFVPSAFHGDAEDTEKHRDSRILTPALSISLSSFATRRSLPFKSHSESWCLTKFGISYAYKLRCVQFCRSNRFQSAVVLVCIAGNLPPERITHTQHHQHHARRCP